MWRFQFCFLLLCSVLWSSPTESADPSSGDDTMIKQVEQAIVKQTNEFRNKHDLDAVSRDENLMKSASDFANFMAKTSKYGHNADGKTPAQRAKAAGYSYCVVRENIAYRTNTGEVTAEGLIDVFVQGWIDSPPHRENMLADYVTDTGVAVATTDGVTYYAVQLFGRPKSRAIKIKIRNESAELQTLISEANDSQDEIEMPPRTIIKMTRCFPTTLWIKDADSEMRLTESSELVLTDQGIERQ
ncbi:secreted protein containing SCP-like extracellular domain protein [Rhodopirellula maiorica SM1]|uniref:Secreted protein containing SCP-like extracellular domain protein n=1 Tax=Rhodopirellula maiorica SM1 TaxID=1265738 RepID=M5RPF3_9BACT|nr:CAP domain-containing protein [Rhodopirellula maiorica]EMI21218.1 secreted protein containing SCP-like extracellular domain protein [Rhodopirellula maiorica SM1]